jgi:predicted lipoprotein with Yx(FWY)xxD motif
MTLGTAAAAGQASAAASSTRTTTQHVVVDLASVAKYGNILVDQKGLPLYYDTADKPPTHWACSGKCLVAWPPLLLPKGEMSATTGKGVTGLGTVKSPSGLQVTWHSKPLYTFYKDSADKVTGQGVGKVWYVVQPDAMTTTPTTGKTTTTTAGMAGGTPTTTATTVPAGGVAY